MKGIHINETKAMRQLKAKAIIRDMITANAASS